MLFFFFCHKMDGHKIPIILTQREKETIFRRKKNKNRFLTGILKIDFLQNISFLFIGKYCKKREEIRLMFVLNIFYNLDRQKMLTLCFVNYCLTMQYNSNNYRLKLSLSNLTIFGNEKLKLS